MRGPDVFVVVCTDDGVYYLTTRRVFASRSEAEEYALSVSLSRNPIVVAGDFRSLRFEVEGEGGDA